MNQGERRVTIPADPGHSITCRYDPEQQGSSTLQVFLILVFVFTLTQGVATGMDNTNGITAAQTGVGDPIIIRGPVIVNTTQNSTTVRWITDQDVPGSMEYRHAGTDPSLPAWTRVSEALSGQTHQIVLPDLDPGQVYAYRISGNAQEYRFRTYPAVGPFQFVVYGDTREQLPAWNQSLHTLVAHRIAQEEDCLFVVHTGDLVNNPADDEEWGRFFEASGSVLPNMTFYPVAGNHEGDLTRYEDLFGYPPWYSFYCADLTFLVLNSNSLRPDEARAQDRWLGQELAGRSGWTFAALHHPLCSSDEKHWGGFVDTADKYRPLFEKNMIEAVFSGHVHAYEHYESRGVHYFTIATGGAPFYPLSPEKPPGFRAAMENTLAYARVTVDQDLALVEIIPVARVWDGNITLLPPGVVAERVLIMRSHAGFFGIWPFSDIKTTLFLGNWIDLPLPLKGSGCPEG